MTRVIPALLALACAGAIDGETGEPGGTDTPQSTAETAETADTGPITPVGGDPVLVVPHGGGVTFVDLDGAVQSFTAWSDLVGPCSGCGAEGSSPDGNGLLLSFTTGGGGGNRPGAVARVSLDGTLDFRLDGFSFPHDVIRDPIDDTLIVAETSANQLTWIAADGSSSAEVRALDASNTDFVNTPNGAERLDHEGRTYVVVSHRPNNGRITMWDITDDTPAFVWRFPATGVVDTPHCPILRQVDGTWWLLWAHTESQGRNDGTVGVARLDDPTSAPVYVADLAPNATTETFTFLRGVELTSDGRLFATDSGAGSRGQGRVLEAPWPSLSPTGASGDAGDRVFVELGDTTTVLDGIRSPFEAWEWDQVIQP